MEAKEKHGVDSQELLRSDLLTKLKPTLVSAVQQYRRWKSVLATASLPTDPPSWPVAKKIAQKLGESKNSCLTASQNNPVEFNQSPS